MAKGLLKTKSWKYGIDGNFWVIGEIRQNRLYNVTGAKFIPYVNKAAFKADKFDFIEELIFELESIPGWKLNQQAIYDYARTTEGNPLFEAIEDTEDV